MMTRPTLIEGTRIEPLGHERIVHQLSIGEITLYLTTCRLISVAGSLFSRELRLALLRDVDFVGMGERRLPWWVLLAGVVWLVAGLVGGGHAGGGHAARVLVFLIGLGIIVSWFWFKRRVLLFTVSGQVRWELPVMGFRSMDEVDAFVNHFFHQKHAAP